MLQRQTVVWRHMPWRHSSLHAVSRPIWLQHAFCQFGADVFDVQSQRIIAKVYWGRPLLRLHCITTSAILGPTPTGHSGQSSTVIS